MWDETLDELNLQEIEESGDSLTDVAYQNLMPRQLSSEEQTNLRKKFELTIKNLQRLKHDPRREYDKDVQAEFEFGLSVYAKLKSSVKSGQEFSDSFRCACADCTANFPNRKGDDNV